MTVLRACNRTFATTQRDIASKQSQQINAKKRSKVHRMRLTATKSGAKIKSIGNEICAYEISYVMCIALHSKSSKCTCEHYAHWHHNGP